VTYDSALGTVLVVDDNAENRAVAKAVLEDEDVPVVLAASGEEAIAAFSRVLPRGILLDIRMPGIAGKVAVEAHGGGIWIEDGAPGAVFCVRITDVA
jgi:DNA-binding NtrC family response regulator